VSDRTLSGDQRSARCPGTGAWGVAGLDLRFVVLGLLIVVAAPHLIGLLRAAGTVEDRYFYFDTFVDPTPPKAWRTIARTPPDSPWRTADGSCVNALIRDDRW
jgi:hypothetical protein